MKISTYSQLLLVVGVVFFIAGLMINESAVRYPDANMTDDNMTAKYDFSDDINNSISPLKTAMENVVNPDVGFFSKLSSGLAAIHYAVIALVSVSIGTIGYGIILLSGGAVAFGIPAYLLSVAFISLFVWIVFKLISIYQRWEI